MSGRAERDAVLDRFEDSAADLLAMARAEGRHLAALNGTVTIDDVRDALGDRMPTAEERDPRWMGSVFNCADFVKVGATNSDRRTCHARPIAIFALASPRRAPLPPAAWTVAA